MTSDLLFDENDIQKTVEQMTASHLNNIMQLAVFYTGNREIYAINISKIQNFVILDEIEIVPNHDKQSVIAGVADIRGEVVTFINLDRWLGAPPVDASVYRVGIVCNFNRRKIGILVHEIIRIEDKLSSELKIPETKAMKILYMTRIMLEGKEAACSVFDAERLLGECGLGEESAAFVPPPLLTLPDDRRVLIAEDSPTAARKITDFFDSLEIPYELYGDGAALIERLEAVDPKTVGLIVTDLEMPVRDGFSVIAHVKQTPALKAIPVVVNSSMTSKGIVEKVKSLGAADLVNKSDLQALYGLVEHYLQTGGAR